VPLNEIERPAGLKTLRAFSFYGLRAGEMSRGDMR